MKSQPFSIYYEKFRLGKRREKTPRSRKRKTSAMQHQCPICKTPTDSAVHRDFPFCSERCRVRDLGNWARERYVVSEPIFEEEDLTESPNQNDNDH
jgi:uncharacterized protein